MRFVFKKGVIDPETFEITPSTEQKDYLFRTERSKLFWLTQEYLATTHVTSTHRNVPYKVPMNIRPKSAARHRGRERILYRLEPKIAPVAQPLIKKKRKKERTTNLKPHEGNAEKYRCFCFPSHFYGIATARRVLQRPLHSALCRKEGRNHYLCLRKPKRPPHYSFLIRVGVLVL